MAELDDEPAWIRKSQEGDHEAFEALIMTHQRMIHSLAFRMTGSLADAEDLAQETFILAFRQLGSFRGEARFSSWLYRIAMNLCLNWKKREARQLRLLEKFGQEKTDENRPIASRAQEVQSALLKLHPKQRAAVALTIYEGMNHAEAAKILGCSETTVSWRMFAARKKLKKLLAHAQAIEETHE